MHVSPNVMLLPSVTSHTHFTLPLDSLKSYQLASMLLIAAHNDQLYWFSTQWKLSLNIC